jgi:hypothetical protein
MAHYILTWNTVPINQHGLLICQMHVDNTPSIYPSSKHLLHNANTVSNFSYQEIDLVNIIQNIWPQYIGLPLFYWNIGYLFFFNFHLLHIWEVF